MVAPHMITMEPDACVDDVSYIESQANPHPWRRHEIVMLMADRNIITRVAHCNLTCEPVGYSMLHVWPHAIEVLSVAVVPSARRAGVGEALIADVDQIANEIRRHMLSAIVDERNLAAQLFFRYCGFEAVAIERRAIANRIDGYWFQREARRVGA